MFTKEKLENSSAKSERAGSSKVLTSEQAFERAISPAKTLVCFSSREKRVFFFTDDHIFGFGVLPKDWVSSTTFFPIRVAEREGLENGIVDTVEKYISVFAQGYKQITSMQELIDFFK